MKNGELFYNSIMYHLIFLVRTTGSLKDFLMVFGPCLRKMKEIVKNARLKYGILLRFCFTLYEFGLEIKFMYGFANSLIQEFCEVQTRLLHIIEDQNFDHRDLEMFKDLNNLAYAAFYNSVGRL